MLFLFLIIIEIAELNGYLIDYLSYNLAQYIQN